jgi:diacylglycerol kinase (ATP)
MRAAAILGPGCSSKHLKPFQAAHTETEWHTGMPSADDRVDVVLLFGGDGTIHRHLKQLVALGLPVLVVPSGSGNDFARALGLSRVRDSLAAWKNFCTTQSNVRAIDLGTITPADEPPAQSIYFSCVAGVGIDGEISRRANNLPRWLRGHGGYTLSLAATIFRFAPFPVKILTPAATAGSPWVVRSDQPTILAAFANTPTAGGGMRIAPKAKMDDGLLDICIVAGMDPFKLFCMFPTVYSGSHLKVTGVEYFQNTRLFVETESPFDVYADGEYVCRTPVEIGVHAQALKVVTP